MALGIFTTIHLDFKEYLLIITNLGTPSPELSATEEFRKLYNQGFGTNEISRYLNSVTARRQQIVDHYQRYRTVGVPHTVSGSQDRNHHY